MKIHLVLVLALFTACAATNVCNNGAAENPTSSTVTCTTGTCTSPIFVEYTGMSTQAYGCASCSDTETCKECDATTTACNGKVSTPEDAYEFECFKYSYDTDKKKFTAAKTATTCHALKDTIVKCNSPGEKAEQAYTQTKNGCGPCGTTALSDKTCKDCSGTKCNSATTLTFILAPLLAVIFHMM